MKTFIKFTLESEGFLQLTQIIILNNKSTQFKIDLIYLKNSFGRTP